MCVRVLREVQDVVKTVLSQTRKSAHKQKLQALLAQPNANAGSYVPASGQIFGAPGPDVGGRCFVCIVFFCFRITITRPLVTRTVRSVLTHTLRRKRFFTENPRNPDALRCE